MDSYRVIFLFLFAALLGLVCLVTYASQSGLPQWLDWIFTTRPSQRLRRKSRRITRRKRPIQRISLEQLENMLRQQRDDLLVVDLRPAARRAPLPLPNALAVEPSELKEILDWLPADRSIVFCGIGSRWMRAIRRSPCRLGVVPFYLLEDRFGRLEVA